jgi:hypothetical protein
MKVRFLLDENLSPRLKAALLRLNPAIDVVRVGDPGARRSWAHLTRMCYVTWRYHSGCWSPRTERVCLLTLKHTGQQVGICGDCSGFVRGHR